MYTKIISKTSVPYSYKESIEELIIRVNTLDYQYVGSQWIAGRVLNKDEAAIYCFSFALNPSFTPLENREYIYVPTDYLEEVKSKLLYYQVFNSREVTVTDIYPNKEYLYRRSIENEVDFFYTVNIEESPNVPLNIKGYESLGKYSHPLFPTLFFSGRWHISPKGYVIYEYSEVNDFYYLEGTRYISPIRPKGLDQIIPDSTIKDLQYSDSITLDLGCKQYCECLGELINNDTKTVEINIPNFFTKGEVSYFDNAGIVQSQEYCQIGQTARFKFNNLKYQVDSTNPPIYYRVTGNQLLIHDSSGLIDQITINSSTFDYDVTYYCLDFSTELIYTGNPYFDPNSCELTIINSYPEETEREYLGFFTGNYIEILPNVFVYQYQRKDSSFFYSLNKPDYNSYSYTHFFAAKSLRLTTQLVEELKVYNEEQTDSNVLTLSN